MVVCTLQNLKQRGVAATYIAEFQQYLGQTDWNDNTLKDQYYKGLKDSIKDEIARSDRLESLYEMIALAIKIDNRYYERQLEHKGQYNPGFGKKAKQNQPYYLRKMEVDATFKRKPQTSKEEMTRRYEKGLCFECSLLGHQAASHYMKQGGKTWKGSKQQINTVGRGAYNMSSLP